MKYQPLLLSPLGLIPMGMPAANAGDVSLPPNARPGKYEKFAPAWTGFYAGVNLGVISDHSSETGFGPAVAPGFSSYCFGGGFAPNCNFSNSQTATGVLGGVQIGYNFQNGNWLYGVETDFDFSSARKQTTGVNNTYAFIGTWTAKTGVEDFGTVRLRLGYAFDRALIYATGGLAYANMVNTFQAGSGTGSYSWSGTGWRTGYAIGGGLEYMLTRNVSIKGEALYYDLGHVDHVMTGPFNSVFGLSDHMTGVVARVGINYLFH